MGFGSSWARLGERRLAVAHRRPSFCMQGCVRGQAVNYGFFTIHGLIPPFNDPSRR